MVSAIWNLATGKSFEQIQKIWKWSLPYCELSEILIIIYKNFKLLYQFNIITSKYYIIQTFLDKTKVYTHHILHHIDPPWAKIFKVTINIHCPLVVNLFKHSINQNKATTSTNTSAIQRNKKIAVKKRGNSNKSISYSMQANLMSKKSSFSTRISALTLTFFLKKKFPLSKQFSQNV